MMESAPTYRAVQAVAPGQLELVQSIRGPAPGEVRIRIEACGVCHSNSATVEGILPIEWPRVPDHEAVGRSDVIGEGVEGWRWANALASASSAAAAGTASTAAMATS